MQLPMEYPLPMKTKYVDEETTATNRWMIFGEYGDLADSVDISDGTQDIITHIPRWRAETIIEARNVFVNILIELGQTST
jgi:hypothetical protein